MNKSETREVAKARQYAALFEATRDASNKARSELMAVAAELQVSGHPEFTATRRA